MNNLNCSAQNSTADSSKWKTEQAWGALGFDVASNANIEPKFNPAGVQIYHHYNTRPISPNERW